MRRGKPGMKIQPRNRDERSIPRDVLAEQLTEESGTWGKAAYQPGSYGCHELLDRTAILANELDGLVVRHPACVLNPEWHSMATRALDILWDLYHLIGDAHLDGEDWPRDPGQPLTREHGYESR